ncbi:hypothetical protein P3342_010216 [Pyrenophora teres f. teres]|nr:hypothetical protein P3342_010216 [Pyrenophora teres f. teres]
MSTSPLPKKGTCRDSAGLPQAQCRQSVTNSHHPPTISSHVPLGKNPAKNTFHHADSNPRRTSKNENPTTERYTHEVRKPMSGPGYLLIRPNQNWGVKLIQRT